MDHFWNFVSLMGLGAIVFTAVSELVVAWLNRKRKAGNSSGL